MWREASTNYRVTLEVRATDVVDQFDSTWKDPTEALKTSKINLSGEEFSLVFGREVDDVEFIFSMEGIARDDQLQGVLWTVWGEEVLTGKLLKEDHSNPSEGLKTPYPKGR